MQPLTKIFRDKERKFMIISRLHYLRGELEAEEISLEEVSEIEAAFAEVPDVELTDLRENAMASDMLDVLEGRVSTVEKTIYNWVKRNFGESEANDPSWDISSLADEINNIQVIFGAEDSTLIKLLGEE